MSRDTEYEAKMDALDLVINVLKDHEKNLDRLIGRLADALDKKLDDPGLLPRVQ